MTVEMETPTAVRAAGARNEIACDGVLTSGHSTKPARGAILVWDRSAGSCERLALVREGRP